MRKLINKVRLVFSAVVVILVMTGFSATAYAANAANPASTKNPTNLTNCQHMHVHVSGKTSTATCLDNLNKTTSRVSPNTSVVSCSSYTLEIYADSNQNGWTICFDGQGSVNMTDYTGPAPYFWWSWNDQASSYVTGQCYGSFYSDTNEAGQIQSFGRAQARNFDGQGGRLANDTLSSIYIIGC